MSFWSSEESTDKNGVTHIKPSESSQAAQNLVTSSVFDPLQALVGEIRGVPKQVNEGHMKSRDYDPSRDATGGLMNPIAMSQAAVHLFKEMF